MKTNTTLREMFAGWNRRADGLPSDEEIEVIRNDVRLDLEARVKELEKEVVRNQEEFIACITHIESPNQCVIKETGYYIFLLNVLPNGSSVTMWQKVTVPILEDGEELPYPCQEWREFRKNKKPWPHIPFKDYNDYKTQMADFKDSK